MVFLAIVSTWFVLAVGVGLLLGAGIRTADRRSTDASHVSLLPADFTVADILAARTAQPST